MNRGSRNRRTAWLVLAPWLTTVGCGGGGEPTAVDARATPAAVTSSATRVSIGELFFNDTSLSASSRQACASCHAKASAHADPAGTLLPLGGPLLDEQGFRGSPSVNYLNANGDFRFAPDGKPFGGFFWDGRAANRQAQAAGPLLAAAEMANASVAELAAKVRRVAYFADFSSLFDLPALATDLQVFDGLTLALATYQAEDPDYMLFNSKFDRVLDGTAAFTAQEARGQQAFNDPAHGNCASCHTSRVGGDGSRPLFTNFSYAALGLPRNAAIRANADTAFFDMGLCGPKRTDLAARTDLCGQFKVPTLRNVALTAPYFHHAGVATLEDAVAFYATRDTDPARWYPIVNGRPDRFNDLPTALRGNVIQSAPFGLAPGAPPRLSAPDVADIAAFLRTLSDDPSAAPGKPTVTR